MVAEARKPGGSGKYRSLAWAVVVTWLLGLAALAVMFRVVGEKSWPVVLALYLPRLLWLLPGLAVLPLAIRRRERALLASCAAGLFLWLLPVAYFVVPHSRPSVAQPVLRVLSYNTSHLVDGADGLRSLIQQTKANVVLLQWTSHVAEEAISGPAFAGWTSRRIGQYTIASRFPILSAEPIGDFPTGYGPPGAHALLDTPLGQIEVLDIRPQSARTEIGARRHMGLRARIADLVEAVRSGRAMSHESFREEQLEAIVATAQHATHPLLIAGDFNLPDGSRLFRQFFSGYRDAFRDAGWGFGWTHPAKLPWMRLDRILLTPRFRAQSFEVLPRMVSGHRAIFAVIGQDAS